MFGRKLIVSQHNPGVAVFQLTVLVCLFFVAVIVAYVYGRATVSLEYAAALAEREELQAIVVNLTDSRAKLRERITMLERAQQIDRQAYDEVDRYVVELQSDIYSLREEVGFYRGIVSSEHDRGLQIQSFDIRLTGESRHYRYNLVLTQDMKNDKVASGLVKLSVSGEKGGQVVQLSPTPIKYGEEQDIEFQFKHFQKLEGTFTLPVGFEPNSVSVEVVDSEAHEVVTEKQFDWLWPVG